MIEFCDFKHSLMLSMDALGNFGYHRKVSIQHNREQKIWRRKKFSEGWKDIFCRNGRLSLLSYLITSSLMALYFLGNLVRARSVKSMNFTNLEKINWGILNRFHIRISGPFSYLFHPITRVDTINLPRLYRTNEVIIVWCFDKHGCSFGCICGNCMTCSNICVVFHLLYNCHGYHPIGSSTLYKRTRVQGFVAPSFMLFTSSLLALKKLDTTEDGKWFCSIHCQFEAVTFRRGLIQILFPTFSFWSGFFLFISFIHHSSSGWQW